MTKLEKLIDAARSRGMTAEELRIQRQSFVYGNCNIENPMVSRAIVQAADWKLSQETKDEIENIERAAIMPRKS